MNLFRHLNPGHTVCALDFGASEVTVVIADKNSRGDIRILGLAESRALGVERGEVIHVGDAVESIHHAAKNACRSAGVELRSIYYNMDDPLIEYRRPVGSRMLDGEGEIQPADIKQAVHAARRLVGDFEKTVIYAKETNFVVDDKDPVALPLGIFGHKISLSLETLLARTSHFDAWQKIMRRAGFPIAKPVLSGLSTVYGVLSSEERKGLKMVWDLGSDLMTGVIYGDDCIRAYRVIPHDGSAWDQSASVVAAVSQSWQKEFGGISDVVLTGDLSKEEKMLTATQEETRLLVRRAAPQGIEKLSQSSQASLAGLVSLALDMKKKSMIARPEKGMLVSARQKAESFLNDYF